MAETTQSKIIQIPERFSGRQRKKIADEVIQFIKRRTQSGIDVNGNLFARYSKSYEKTGTVDLTETEQMINSLELLSHGKGFIRIGFGNRSANNKAAWLQSPRGRKAGISPRIFVGITQADLNRILENL